MIHKVKKVRFRRRYRFKPAKIPKQLILNHFDLIKRYIKLRIKIQVNHTTNKLARKITVPLKKHLNYVKKKFRKKSQLLKLHRKYVYLQTKQTKKQLRRSCLQLYSRKVRRTYLQFLKKKPMKCKLQKRLRRLSPRSRKLAPNKLRKRSRRRLHNTLKKLRCRLTNRYAIKLNAYNVSSNLIRSIVPTVTFYLKFRTRNVIVR